MYYYKVNYPQYKTQIKYFRGGMNLFRKRLLTILTCILIFSLTIVTACSSDEEAGDTGPAESTDELVWGITEEADTLDPRATVSTYSVEVFEMVFNSLVYPDGDLEIQKDLATDIEVKDDDVTYVFELRDDVTWHDGEPLTAHDVEFTYETILDPEFGSPHKERIDYIKRVEAIDDYTVEFETEDPHAAFLHDLDRFIVPKHAAPRNPFEDVDEVEEEKEGEDVFAYEPIGSGPFKVVEWRPNDTLTLERYEDYHEGPAELKKIIRREIPEVEAIYADLMAGDIDKGIVPDQEIDDIDENPDYTLIQERTLNYFPIFINHGYDGHDKLSQLEVRRALNKAADYDQIVEHIFPTSYRAHTPIIEGTWAHDPDAVRVYEHDPEKARELLEEAGYEEGIELELIMSDSNTNMEFGEMLSAQFEEAGIDLDVNTMDFGAMLDRTLDGDYQLSSVGMTNMTDPDEFMQRYVDGGGASNYENPEMDELIIEARRTVDDQEKRAELYSEIQEIFSEEAVDIPIRNSTILVVWNSDFNMDYNYIERYRNMKDAYWD